MSAIALLLALVAGSLEIGAFGTIHALFVDHPAVLAATEGGFFLYDGNTHRVVFRKITPQPVHFAVAEPGHAVVYFVMDQTLYRWLPGQPDFQRLFRADRPVQGLGIDPEHLWLDYGNGVVQRLTHQGFPVDYQRPPETVRWSGPAGQLSPEDVRVQDIAPLQRRWFPDVGDVRFSVFVEAWNRLYAGSEGLGLWIYDARTLTALDSVNPGLWPGPVQALVPTTQGNWWIATPSALNHWRDPHTRVMLAGARPDFPLSEVQDLLWRAGTLWVATDKGLLRYTADHFAWPSLPRALGFQVLHLAATPQGLWVATDHGWGPLEGEPVALPVEVYRILPAGGGVVVLTEDGVYYQPSDTAAPRLVQDPRNWLRGTVSVAGATYRDTVWVVGDLGVVSWVPGDTAFHYLPTPFEPAHQPVQDLAVNARHLLIASAFAAYEYRRPEHLWQPLQPWKGLDHLGTLRRVALNGDTLAVAGDRGVVLLWP